MRILIFGRPTAIDQTGAAKSHEDLLNEVEDYARKRKFDTTAHKIRQHGAIQWTWEQSVTTGSTESGRTILTGLDLRVHREGQEKSKGQTACFNTGSSGHFA